MGDKPEERLRVKSVSSASVSLTPGLCRKNDMRTSNPSQFLLLIGQPQKFETRTLPVLAHRPGQCFGPALCVSYALPPCLAMSPWHY